MTESPIFLPEAKGDVADAYLWYEGQSQGLGMEFQWQSYTDNGYRIGARITSSPFYIVGMNSK